MIGTIDPLAYTLLSSSNTGEIQDLNSFKTEPQVSFSDAVAAGFSREALVELEPAKQRVERSKFDFDPEHNPIQAIKGTKYEEFADVFAKSPNAEFTAKLKLDIESQLKRGREVQGVGGFIGSLGGAILNPSTLIPIGAAATKGSAISRIVKGGLATGAAASVSETAGLLTDVTRTKEELVAAAAGSAVLGGLLFGLSAKAGARVGVPKETQPILSRALMGEADQTVEQALKTPEAKFYFNQDKGASELAKTNPVFSGLLRATSRVSPELRVMTSESAKAKDLLLNMAQTNMRTQGELSGKVTRQMPSIEAEIKIRNTKATVESIEIGKDFTNFKKAGHKLSENEFYNEVSKAIRRGGEHPNKEIAGAAKKQTQRIWNSYLGKLKDAQKKGLISEDLKLPEKADNYLPLYFDREKILDNMPGFRQNLKTALRKTNPRKTEVELDELADQIFKDSIATDPKTILPGYKMGAYKASSTQKKTLDIVATDIEDFLVNDYRYILNKYIKEVETELAFKERYGSTSMKDQLAEIEQEFDSKILKADAAEARRLKANKDEVMSDMAALRDIIQGKYKIPDNPYSMVSKSSRGLLSLNYLAFMGFGALAQVADMAKHIGVVRMSNLGKRMGKFLGTFKGEVVKLSKEDQVLLDVGLESYTNSRAAAAFDLDDAFTRHSGFDRVLDTVNGKYSNFIGMSLINDVNRRLASDHIASNMITDMKALVKGSLSESRKLNLFKAGIDVDKAKIYLKQYNKHKVTIKGVDFPNINDWDEAGLDFLSVIKNEVDNTIIVPTAGSKSLWMRGEYGKVISQFKGFVMGAYHKSLLPHVQDIYGAGGENAAIAASRILGGIVLGATVYTLRETLKGREVDLSPDKLLVEGIDRSGAFPILMDVSNILDKHGLGLASAIGTERVSRFRDVSTLQLLGGPSARIIDQTASSASRVVRGQGTDKDKRNLLRLAPGYNVLYWNWLTDKIGR